MRNLVNRGLEKLGYRIFRTTEMHPLDTVIRRRLHPDFFFVQVGANDGKQFDPIRSYVRYYQWKGILLEPVADYFAELKENYADCPNLKLINAAIADHEGTVTIYRVNPLDKSLPKWKQGIASLHEGHHLRSGTSDDVMTAEQVPCLPLMSLLDRHNISSIDLLQIDAEGCDLAIIKSLDLTRILPKILHFEHRLGDKVHSQKDFSEAMGMLVANGYHLFVNQTDCLAYL
ncbi:MAG: FkbM family methyltransferase [Verrucomicrobiae bacterium]